MARILWALFLGALVACGGEDDGAADAPYDPFRYERSPEEWEGDCPEHHFQLYTSEGAPYCPETWPDDVCVRYYGGWILRDGIRARAESCADSEDRRVVVCLSWDSATENQQLRYLCLSPADARRRSI